MELEGADRDIHLDMIKELNLSFLNEEESKEPDMLWEIGSGKNWMGYHLCTYLGLHKFLYESQNKHISSFIVIDQPSQVYFPSDTYEQRVDTKGAENQDILGTRKIFELLDKFIKDVKGTRQIIVLEHADKRIYGPNDKVNIPSIHEVEDWHGDLYLIPSTWKL